MKFSSFNVLCYALSFSIEICRYQFISLFLLYINIISEYNVSFRVNVVRAIASQRTDACDFIRRRVHVNYLKFIQPFHMQLTYVTVHIKSYYLSYQ